MRLHNNKEAFNTIVIRISERSGIPESMVEKDYYVSMVLKELSEKQPGLPAYFKGGTCLYKAYLDMRRFSEDIDLTVRVDGLTNSQKKSTLARASEKYECMNRLKGDPLENNQKGSITAIYGYDPNFEVDANDKLQRYGKLKVEATSFTISEPYETSTIAPLIYQHATENEKNILRTQFDISEFDIQNISVERMFADKLLAVEFYLEKGKFFDVAKHLYDINAMIDMKRIQTMLADDETFIKFLSYKREEEKNRIGSNLDRKPLSDFMMYKQDSLQIPKLIKAYEDMQRTYVIKSSDLVDYQRILNTIAAVKVRCMSISKKESLQLYIPDPEDEGTKTTQGIGHFQFAEAKTALSQIKAENENSKRLNSFALSPGTREQVNEMQNERNVNLKHPDCRNNQINAPKVPQNVDLDNVSCDQNTGITLTKDYLEETPDDTIARIMKQHDEKASDDGPDGRTGNSQGHDEYNDGTK